MRRARKWAALAMTGALASMMLAVPTMSNAGPNCTILGTPGNDVLRGTARNDVICGFGGNDVIRGGGGGDILRGGKGNDRIDGGPGDDVLKGGRGRDRLTGGRGDDIVRGGAANDTLAGGLGNDMLRGGGGHDSCASDAGDIVRSCESGQPPDPDDQDPSPPGNLRTTTLTATRVVLMWNASSDDVGVEGYRVRRDSAGLGTTSATTFTDDSVDASTTYEYTVVAFDAAGNTASSSLQVTTPGGGGGSAIVLRAAGDIACAPSDPRFDDPTRKRCAHRATADLLDGADAVIAVGDLQYERGTPAEYAGSYDPSWGKYRSITYPAAGDEEYGTPGAAGYFGYWGAKAHQSSDGYYSFDLGAWHVVILNSVCDEVGGCGAGSPQAQWLEQDLQANTSQCTLAALHVPVFASRRKVDAQVNTTYKPFFRLLDEHGAEIVLAGNSHFYERFAPQNVDGTATSTGVREFLVGTGGKSIGGLHDSVRLPTSQVASKQGAGVLELRLGASSYDWEFLPVPGNPFTDSGSTSCH
jgi:Ca2+-binding RTX toxin-like protein